MLSLQIQQSAKLEIAETRIRAMIILKSEISKGGKYLPEGQSTFMELGTLEALQVSNTPL